MYIQYMYIHTHTHIHLHTYDTRMGPALIECILVNMHIGTDILAYHIERAKEAAIVRAMERAREND